MALKVTLETEAFKKIGTKLIPTLFPPCERYGSTDIDDYWRCYVRHWTATWWHYSSTCKMGHGPDDKTAVVDSNLRYLSISLGNCTVAQCSHVIALVLQGAWDEGTTSN